MQEASTSHMVDVVRVPVLCGGDVLLPNLTGKRNIDSS